jgi:hypothetical protein
MARSESKGGGEEGFDRRQFIGALTASTAIFISGNAIIHPGEAWGLESSAIKPETMLTLIKIARDIYPHDRLADKYYAVAVKGYDAKAAADPKTLAMINEGVAGLDEAAKKAHGTGYAAVGWEADRVKLLTAIESTAFFQTIRGGLVTGLYNQKEVWPLFGYEGESASKGGYINRGFNDLTWL